VPVQRLIEAFAAAAVGPVRRRKPPPRDALPPDPIIEARRYDASHAGATPRFLDRQVAAIEAALGPDRTEALVTRGFALPGHGGPQLVRHLYGDWRGVIGSHSFTQALRGRLARGEELHEALARTADAIAAQVVRAFRDDGYAAWATQASRATQIGVAEKRATGMASFLGSASTEGQLTPTALGYAHSGFLGLLRTHVVPADQPMIVLELAAAAPKGWDHAELYLPSHVSPERVARAYLGFSTWHDVHEYLRPPDEQQTWYALDPGARDADGRPARVWRCARSRSCVRRTTKSGGCSARCSSTPRATTRPSSARWPRLTRCSRRRSRPRGPAPRLHPVRLAPPAERGPPRARTRKRVSRARRCAGRSPTTPCARSRRRSRKRRPW
jgi:hypothetical protein